ncbi:MAG TPA: hypothetical protein VFU43_26910 [Streptosporangiaceae bacterium]|nr:hypothetical protein [Streptosporangiaceae bacterium]
MPSAPQPCRRAVFWQSQRTRKQARPGVRPSAARAGGIPELEIVVDVYERYAYRFADLPVRTSKKAWWSASRWPTSSRA